MPEQLEPPSPSDDRIEVARRLVAGGLPTPFLAIDRAALAANLDRWHRHLLGVPPYYAVKANIDPLVLRTLFARGANADVASAFEVEVCRSLGLGGDRMILSNPRKDRDTVLALKEVRAWATTVDSEEEIEKLAVEGIPGGGYDPVLFVRIKVPTKGVKQDLSTKFGIRVVQPNADPPTVGPAQRVALGEVRATFARARAAGFSRFGLAFHVGTQCADPEVYRSALAVCRAVADGLKADGVAIGWIDIGGGFADARVAAEHAPGTAVDPHDGLLAGVGEAAAATARAGFRLLAEPGRYLVADAGFLVTRVTYDRSTDLTGRRIQIDDGVYRTLSGRVHDQREFRFRAFRADPTKRPFLGVTTRIAVWGCSCDSFDKVADDLLLPADLQVGDYLVADCIGAYSTSFGSNTNGFQPATVVLYWHDGAELRWEVSPLADQNRILLAHIRRWAGDEPPHLT
jgi:ornithine decarboxylase